MDDCFTYFWTGDIKEMHVMYGWITQLLDRFPYWMMQMDITDISPSVTSSNLQGIPQMIIEVNTTISSNY